MFRFLSIAAAVLVASQAQAATFEFRTVTTYPDSAPRTCFLVDSSTASSTAAGSDCTSPNGNVSAVASSGLEGLKTFAKVTGASDDGKTSARASAYLFDEFSFSVDSGIFRLGVNISGSIDVGIGPQAWGFTTLDLAYYNLSGFRTPVEVFDHYKAYQSGLGVYLDEIYDGAFGMNYVDIPFTDGYLRLDAVLSSFAACTVSITSPACRAANDFSSTAAFMGGSILASDGSGPIAGASVTSASGIDYLRDGGDTPPAVPLPAGLPLLLAGLGALAGLRRRQKKAA